jgi:hypothetical protein
VGQRHERAFRDISRSFSSLGPVSLQVQFLSRLPRSHRLLFSAKHLLRGGQSHWRSGKCGSQGLRTFTPTDPRGHHSPTPVTGCARPPGPRRPRRTPGRSSDSSPLGVMVPGSSGRPGMRLSAGGPRLEKLASGLRRGFRGYRRTRHSIRDNGPTTPEPIKIKTQAVHAFAARTSRPAMVGLASAMTSRTVVVRAWEAPDDTLPGLDGHTGPALR